MAVVLRIAPPRVIVLAVSLADAVATVVAASFLDIRTAIMVGLVAGLGQQLGKLARDSSIQKTVPERMRTSVFGRSEALLHLSWVHRLNHRRHHPQRRDGGGGDGRGGVGQLGRSSARGAHPP